MFMFHHAVHKIFVINKTCLLRRQVMVEELCCLRLQFNLKGGRETSRVVDEYRIVIRPNVWVFKKIKLGHKLGENDWGYPKKIFGIKLLLSKHVYTFLFQIMIILVITLDACHLSMLSQPQIEDEAVDEMETAGNNAFMAAAHEVENPQPKNVLGTSMLHRDAGELPEAESTMHMTHEIPFARESLSMKILLSMPQG
ncbi:hypothetical protein ACJX0J_018755, partial [Zea mays]